MREQQEQQKQQMPHPQGYLLRAIRHIPAKARSGLYAGKQVGVANRVSSEYEVRCVVWWLLLP